MRAKIGLNSPFHSTCDMLQTNSCIFAPWLYSFVSILSTSMGKGKQKTGKNNNKDKVQTTTGRSFSRTSLILTVLAIVSALGFFAMYTNKPRRAKQEDNLAKEKTCENEQKPGATEMSSQMPASVATIFDGVSAPKLKQIPRRPWPEAKELIERNEAVVITGGHNAEQYVCEP